MVLVGILFGAHKQRHPVRRVREAGVAPDNGIAQFRPCDDVRQFGLVALVLVQQHESIRVGGLAARREVGAAQGVCDLRGDVVHALHVVGHLRGERPVAHDRVEHHSADDRHDREDHDGEQHLDHGEPAPHCFFLQRVSTSSLGRSSSRMRVLPQRTSVRSV